MSIVLSEDPDIKALEKISFSDPFQESLRKTRRSLMLVSFIGIFIGTFPVEITSFLGFHILEGSVKDVYLRGIINSIVIYYLISFGLSLIIDLYAWEFKKERIKVKHYIDIQKELGGIINNLLEDNTLDDSPSDKTDNFLNKIWPSFLNKTKFKSTLSGLNIRFISRVFSIFLVDILIPIILGCIAIYKTRHGLIPILEKIFS